MLRFQVITLAWNGMLTLLRYEVLNTAGISNYRKAHALSPQDSYLSSELARFLIEKDISLDEGMELIAPLVEMYPKNASYLYTYGLGLYKLGELLKSQKVLQRSWDQKPYYDHRHFLLLKKLNDEIASQNAGTL